MKVEQQTKNIHLPLMDQGQIGKEVIYNHCAQKLDSLLASNIGIYSISYDTLKLQPLNGKYLLLDGPYTNKILYAGVTSEEWEIIDPVVGTVYFIINEKRFAIFTEKKIWDNILDISNEKNIESGKSQSIDIPNDYKGIGGEYMLENSPMLYLYVYDSVKIIFDKFTLPKTTLIIKQCWDTQKKIEFACDKIIWQSDKAKFNQIKPAVFVPKQNSFNIFSFYRLPEKEAIIGTQDCIELMY